MIYHCQWLIDIFFYSSTIAAAAMCYNAFKEKEREEGAQLQITEQITHEEAAENEVRMNPEHYTQLISLLNEKIYRLELDKDRQRKEINRLKRELKAATSKN
jgi:hypothetical protein